MRVCVCVWCVHACVCVCVHACMCVCLVCVCVCVWCVCLHICVCLKMGGGVRKSIHAVPSIGRRPTQLKYHFVKNWVWTTISPAQLLHHEVPSILRVSVTCGIRDTGQSCVEQRLLTLGAGYQPLLPQTTQGLPQVLGLQRAALAESLHHIQG